MADLPSNSPASFQLPGPQVPFTGGWATGLASGVQSSIQNYLNNKQVGIQQQNANTQQAVAQSQIQQQNIQQVDSLLKTGLSYPGLLPSFWPTIATKMNQLSPDYKLDPNNPPDNITTYAKQLSDISDGVTDKVVTPVQAHAAVVQLNKQSFPSVQDVLPGGATPQQSVQQGQPMPQGQPPMSQNSGIPAQQPMGGAQQQQIDPLSDFASTKAQYDKANSYIASAPDFKQEELRKQLENSSLGLNYRKSLDTLATHANAQYSEGQQNQRNQFNQSQDNLRAAASTFPTQSEDFKNVSDNFSAFNHLMQMSSQMESQGSDTTARVQAEKTALLNFAQMAYPGTGRPGNPEMLETMEKSGPVGTLISQGLNRLDKGDVMTPEQIKGLRQTAVTLYQGREAQQSQLEQSYSQNIQANGGNPQAFLKNLRPQSAVSTSKLFPGQSTDLDPAIGHVMKTKSGSYQYLGGNKSNPENWVKLGEDAE